MAAVVDKDTCVACGSCADACPCGAITIEDFAVVDADSCAGCGSCVDACPCGAIKVE